MCKINLRLLTVIVVLIPLFAIKRLEAQGYETEDIFSHRVDAYLRYIPSRCVDALAGEIEIVESEAEYSYDLKAFGKLPLKFSLGIQYIGIEDTLEIELSTYLTGLTLDFETTLPFFNFNQTYLRLGISPSFYGDDWDFEASNFRLPSRYLLIHQPNTKLTLIGGIVVYPDFENEVLPILGFIYRPNDRLTFNIIPKRPNISYLVNEKVTLFVEGGSFFNSEFEVTKDNLENVVIRCEETRLGSGVKFKFNKFILSSIVVGAVFNRSLEYQDNLGKVTIKDGLYTEFRVEVKL